MGLFIRTRLETRRPPPPPSSSLLPPYRPEIRYRVVGRNVCLWWVGGQVVVRKMEGGILHLPARAGGSGSWNSWLGSRLHVSGFFFLFLSITPSPNPFLPPHNPYPSRPPPSLLLGAAWGSWVPAGGYWGGRGELRAGRDGAPHCNGFREPWGSLKTLHFFFSNCCSRRGERGKMRSLFPVLFLRGPGRATPSAAGRRWPRCAETPAARPAPLCRAVGL